MLLIPVLLLETMEGTGKKNARFFPLEYGREGEEGEGRKEGKRREGKGWIFPHCLTPYNPLVTSEKYPSIDMQDTLGKG